MDIGAELFAIACGLRVREHDREGAPRAGRGGRPSCADLFCKQARRRVDALFTELWANDDDDDYELAQDVLDGRYKWLEEGIVDPSGDGPMIADQPEEVAGAAS